jgi:hypothetical protein
LLIGAVDPDTFAFLSLEQELSVDGLPESVEVETLDILNGSVYSAELNVGSYDAIAATCGLPTQEAVVEISAGATTTVDLNF